MREYFECGCCGEFHPVVSNPSRYDHLPTPRDCRDDANRFTIEQLDMMHPDGWSDVTMEDESAW